MKPKYIEFIGNHPAEKDEDRQYYENLQENWSSYGAAYGKEYLKVEITDYDKTTEEKSLILQIIDELSTKKETV